MDTIWYYILAFLVALSATCVYLISQLIRARREGDQLKNKVGALQSQLSTFDLKTIESKLNPHLFKNVLNSIQSHAYQTYFALDKLANVLDYILYDSQDKFVTPKEEIDFALNLIEINRIKISPLFEFKVKVKVDEDEPLYNQKVLAPLISIDLIENAFKHADLQSQDSFITISFEFKNGIFGLTVANKISSRNPLQKDKRGIGSDTLKHRLRLIYSNSYQLEKVSEKGTYVAYLKIDLREHQAQMHSA